MIRAAFQDKHSALVWWVEQHRCIHWVECQGCVDPERDHYSILTRSNAVLVEEDSYREDGADRRVYKTEKQQGMAIDERQRTRDRKKPKIAQSLRPQEQAGVMGWYLMHKRL